MSGPEDLRQLLPDGSPLAEILGDILEKVAQLRQTHCGCTAFRIVPHTMARQPSLAQMKAIMNK
eukprot:1555055-Rhodomonas_salina.1